MDAAYISRFFHPFHFLSNDYRSIVVRLPNLHMLLQTFFYSLLEILSVQGDLTVKVGAKLLLLILGDLQLLKLTHFYLLKRSECLPVLV